MHTVIIAAASGSRLADALNGLDACTPIDKIVVTSNPSAFVATKWARERGKALSIPPEEDQPHALYKGLRSALSMSRGEQVTMLRERGVRGLKDVTFGYQVTVKEY
jgi:hypothetical protein